VQGVDAAARQAWSAIYAEGHASDEPNPLAGAVANAGMTLAAQGKESDGEAMLREAAAIDPRAARVRTMLGLLLSGQGRLPEAAKELEAARSLSFRETEARTELGFVLLKLGREEEALTELRDVLRVDRRASRPYVGVGMILARRRRMAEAITAFRGALSADPGYGPAHLELAGALDAVGQPAEAWPAAARARPGRGRARRSLAAPGREGAERAAAARAVRRRDGFRHRPGPPAARRARVRDADPRPDPVPPGLSAPGPRSAAGRGAADRAAGGAEWPARVRGAAPLVRLRDPRPLHDDRGAPGAAVAAHASAAAAAVA